MGLTRGIAGNNGAAGWSAFTVSASGSGEGSGYNGAGTRKIYVDANVVDDSGDGSLANPKKTVAAGHALLRTGHADWLHLKKGCVWREGIPGLGKSGVSATDLMLITSYGSGARPKLEFSDVEFGFPAENGQIVDYFGVVGLEFSCYTNDPNSPGFTGNTSAGLDIKCLFHYFHVEDCKFMWTAGNDVSTPFASGAFVRYSNSILFWHRNVVRHSRGLGLITGNIFHPIVQDSLFDDNGVAAHNANNHNLYFQDTNGGGDMLNCISTNTSFNCYKNRSGSNISNSFFAGGGELIVMYGIGEENNPYGFVTTPLSIVDNVFMEGRRTDPNTLFAGGGGGIDIDPGSNSGSANIVSVSRNIVANSLMDIANPNWGILFSLYTVNCTCQNNRVYNWTGLGITDNGTGNHFSGNLVDANGDGNLDSGGATGWPHPGYTLADYNVSLGGPASATAVLDQCALQSKDNWRAAYTAPAINDFFRAAFAMPLLGFDPGPANLARSQINLNFLPLSLDYALINRILTGTMNLEGNTPAVLDANGWPTSVPGSGVTYGWFCESFEQYSGIWIIDWLGTGSIGLNGPHTTVDGSLSGTDGRYRFINGSGNHFFFISIGSTSPAPNNLRRVRCYRADEETLLAAGELFSPAFLAKLSGGGWGTVRFLKWQGQFANTTAATRTPVSYAVYAGNRWRPDFYAGLSSGTGGNFICSAPSTWPGLVDKATIHVKWHASMTTDTNTLAVGGTTAKPIKSSNGKTVFFNGVSGEGPGAGCISTMVYDATLGVWMLFGGNLDGPNITHQGILDGVPWEVMIALANKVNMHPWFTSPYLAMYPMTDYMPGLAQMCHDTLEMGLIPHFESLNEPWNSSGDKPVQWLLNIGEALWGPINNAEEPLGMTLSTMGQAVSAIYGNDRSKYEIVAGVHTDAGEGTASYANGILDSPQYVAHGGSAAVYWVTVISPANYFRETVSSTVGDSMAAAYAVANTAGKATIANDYAASSFQEGQFGLPQLKRHFQGWRTYANTKGVPLKIKPYEGGYSPDFAQEGLGSQIGQLRSASKEAPITADLITQNYADLLEVGAISPSQFSFVGPANDSWAIIRPDLYGTPNPQYGAIQTFNASVGEIIVPELGPVRYIAFAM